MKKHRVIIVGAGMAGLGAAYELSQDPRFAITIVEARDRIGGRTHCEEIQSVPVDVGGFIIYPWYKNMHRMIQELALAHQLLPISAREIYYDINQDGIFVTNKDLGISLRVMGKVAAKLLPVFMGNLDVAEPRLEIGKGTTVRDFFRTLRPRIHNARWESYIDMVCQGYGYPALAEFKSAFLFPMLGNVLLFGSLSTASFFPRGITTFTHTLRDVLVSRGVTLRTSAQVTAVRKNTVLIGNERLSADSIIVTHPLSDAVRYTRFITATVHCSPTPLIQGTDAWGGLFLNPKTKVHPRILTITNTKHLSGKALDNTLTINIALDPEEKTPKPTPAYTKSVTAVLQKYFPELRTVSFTSFTHWKRMMPISTEAYVQNIRNAQGKDGIFFAGDFLGSPSMETALTTGIRAAELVRKTIASAP